MPDFYFHPLKIVEYLGAGVPVVYPSQGGLRELVRDAGLAYSPGSCQHLAACLTRLLDDHSLRRDLAGAAERFVVEADCGAEFIAGPFRGSRPRRCRASLRAGSARRR